MPVMIHARQLQGVCAPTLRRNYVLRRSPLHVRCNTSSAAVTTFDYKGETIAVPGDVLPLFQPVKVGGLELQHRMVYAPLTRCRAINTIPVPEMVTYYQQRASKGGLIISEATSVSPLGHGATHTPGIYTQEQVEAWKPVVKAVHKEGGIMLCQLWHAGRASHPETLPAGEQTVAPSAVPIGEDPNNFVYTSKGAVPYPAPRALELHEIPKVVDQFRAAAANALEAGFDGVEIHGANGYLVDAFTKDSANKRTDDYGGSPQNRARFALEVVEAVTAEIGTERVGIRLSPYEDYLNSIDSDPHTVFSYLVEQLNKYNLAYIHMIEPRFDHGKNPSHSAKDWNLDIFRKAFKGKFIAAGDYKLTSAVEAISTGHADLIAFGRIFLANPDLPKRFLLKAPLNKYDRNTFYTQDPVVGYIDYPFYDNTGNGNSN